MTITKAIDFVDSAMAIFEGVFQYTAAQSRAIAFDSATTKTKPRHKDGALLFSPLHVSRLALPSRRTDGLGPVMLDPPANGLIT